jgi:hypothetical protein
MSPLARERIRYHAMYLIFALVVLTLAACLSINAQDQVVIPAVNLQLPGACMSRQILGVDCPGCGLTRGFISLMHGGWRQAWHYNPGVYFIFFMVVAQVPYRVIQVRRAQLGIPEKSHFTVLWVFVFGMLFVLFGQWILRM